MKDHDSLCSPSIVTVLAAGFALIAAGVASSPVRASEAQQVRVHADAHFKAPPRRFGDEQPRQRIVRFGDLDLAKPEGRRALQGRLVRAARYVCDTEMPPYAQVREAERACEDATLQVAMAAVQPTIMLAADR